MKSRSQSLVTISAASLMAAILGTWLAVLGTRIAPTTGIWVTLVICAGVALLLALGRQSENHRSVGRILDDVENPVRATSRLARD